MRQIGLIEGEDNAGRFSDYLVTEGVKNTADQTAGGAWAIWVEDDDLLDRGRAALDHFRANPADARYTAAAGAAAKLRKESEKSEKRRRTQFVDVRTRWGQPTQLMRPVTVALAALSILVSVGMKLGLAGPTPVENAMLIAPVEYPDEFHVQWEQLDAVKNGQVWRLVTPIFVHYGPLHLIFNMFWLLDLGSMIETRRGSLFLLTLVIVTAIASNLAQYYLGHWGHPWPKFGGMSGINYALFGYAWMKGKFQPHIGIGVQPQTVTLMMFWLFACMTGWLGPVANTAHVAGLLGGLAFGYLPYAAGRFRRRLR